MSYFRKILEFSSREEAELENEKLNKRLGYPIPGGVTQTAFAIDFNEKSGKWEIPLSEEIHSTKWAATGEECWTFQVETELLSAEQKAVLKEVAIEEII